MGWLFFGSKSGKKSKLGFKAVDWSDVEAKIRQLESMAAQSDQAVAKQVIMQTDILVDSILKQGNCLGTTMGERLRSLQKVADRRTLNSLWGLHKKRNELAHEPGSFVADWEKEKYFKDAISAISDLRGLR